jgi:hypothetical protein
VKIMQTLEGGLRLDAEDSSDWHLLQGITTDALSCDESLAHRLAKLVSDKEMAEDWREYIVPDLEEGFSADVLHVTTAIASARLESGGDAGPLWITPDDAFQWYSALNQARLAIEERHHFGPGGEIHLASLTAISRPAFLRSQFYCALQSMLLEYVLR